MQNFEINLESLKSLQSNEGSNVNWARCENGMTFRVMPPWSEKGLIWKEVYTHRFEVSMGKFTRYQWTCSSETNGKPCAICNFLKSLKDKGFDIDPNTSRSFYVNAVITADPTGSYNPGQLVVLRIPFAGVKMIQEAFFNPIVGNIIGLGENGADIICRKEGTGITTKYSFNISQKGRYALNVQVDNLYDLDALFQEESEEDLKVLFQTIAPSVVPGTPVNVNELAIPSVAPFQPSSTPTQQQAPAVSFDQPFQVNTVSPSTNPTQQSLPFDTPTNQTPNPQGSSDKPPCFGQHKDGDIKCILCQHEMMCKQ